MTMSKSLACVCVTFIIASWVGGTAAGVLESAADAIKCPQNLVVANKIEDKSFMKKQINCILGPDSACDDTGLKAKSKYTRPIV